MSLVKIVEAYKDEHESAIDEKTFKAAIDTYKGDINVLYEIYIAQASYNKLVDVLFDVTHRLDDIEEELECCCCECHGDEE